MSQLKGVRRWTVRDIKCEVEAFDKLTPTAIRLTVSEGPPLAFKAGQYAKVVYPNDVEKYYSIASLPGDNGIEFHIRRSGDGESSSHYVLDQLSIGDPVMVTAPMGSSYFRDEHTGPILCVAGGSGLAPIRSIAETAIAKDGAREVHLYFGVRDERDIYFEERFSNSHGRMRTFISLGAFRAVGRNRAPNGIVHEAVAADLSDCCGWKAHFVVRP